MIEIKAYAPADEAALFAMMREEGEDWRDYWGEDGCECYKKALEQSSTFVAYEGGQLAGYVRCREDFGFEIIVHDLLVCKPCRGKQIGRTLMDRVAAAFPGVPVYVMSDVDGYYEKQGYERIGSIFQVK